MALPRGYSLIIVGAVFLLTSILATAARCYVRIRIVRAFRIDDYFIVAACFAFAWMVASICVTVYHGTGRHFDELDPHSAETALKIWWVCYLAYAVTMTLAKISIGVFLLRVCVSKFLRGLTWFTLGHSILAGVIFFFVVAFQCSPVSYFWTLHQPGAQGTCISRRSYVDLGYFYGSVCAVGDITYGLIPIGLVWNLGVNTRTKIALVPILGMAGIASCAVLVRMAYMPTLEDPDFLYATLELAIWSTVEPGLAITASSLATLRPLFSILRDKLGSSHDPDQVDMFDMVKSGPRRTQTVEVDMDDGEATVRDSGNNSWNATSPRINKRQTLIMADIERNISSEDMHPFAVPPALSVRTESDTETVPGDRDRNLRKLHTMSLQSDGDTLIGEPHSAMTRSPSSPSWHH